MSSQHPFHPPNCFPIQSWNGPRGSSRPLQQLCLWVLVWIQRARAFCSFAVKKGTQRRNSVGAMLQYMTLPSFHSGSRQQHMSQTCFNGCLRPAYWCGTNLGMGKFMWERRGQIWWDEGQKFVTIAEVLKHTIAHNVSILNPTEILTNLW